MAEAWDTFSNLLYLPLKSLFTKPSEQTAYHLHNHRVIIKLQHEPALLSGCPSVTPLWQWILQTEYNGCKTISSSFVLCLHIHYIQLPRCCFYYFQWLMFFGTLGWVLSELCDLLYLNSRTYSMGFAVVTAPSLLFAYLLAKAITLLKVSQSLFCLPNTFCYLSCWHWFILAHHCNKRILHQSFSLLPSNFFHNILDRWGLLHPTQSQTSSNNCLIIISLFNSAQYAKHIVKNNLYKNSSFSDKLFWISAFQTRSL